MASKVIAKLPVDPFAQVNKSKSNGVSNGEMVAVSRTPEPQSRGLEAPKGPEAARIAQLEQNIRFLQDQHQMMLAGLHIEIERLRSRNRELQFQLVFVKGSLPSSPSSPEDDSRYKTYASPKPYNVTPLQVEILEKELGELKLQLQETECRNVYLSAIVDEQKKKLERYERDREKERERAMQPDPELLRKLDDAEAIIRRLRRENSDLRRENSASSAQYAHHHHNVASDQRPTNHLRENGSYQSQRGGGNGGGSNQGGRGNGRHHRGNGGGYKGNWFPPLNSQSYWQGGRQNERNGATGQAGENTPLPSLQPNENVGPAPQYHQSRRGHNNNHYHNGEGRKYRQNKSGKTS